MYLTQNIEMGEDSVEVIFEAYPIWRDDSYSDEFGLVKIEPYPFLESMPIWDSSIYIHSENQVIIQYLFDNGKKIYEAFCNLLREETIHDY